MEVLQILLIIFGLLNLAFAGFVYAHSNKKTAITFYVLISVFASLWALSTLATALPLSETNFRYALSGHYVFGYLAYLAFFWFSLYFPQKTRFPLIIPTLLSGITLLFIVFIPFTDIIFSLIENGDALNEKITFNPLGYPAFILMLSGIFALGLITLLKRFHNAHREGAYRKEEFDQYQIYLALLANFIAGTLGIALNLLLPLYGNFSLFYINPIFVTLALIVIGFYNLLKYNLFNVKVVLAEFFAAGIWILFLARVVLSANRNEFITNATLFAISLFFGFFFIQSVLREIKAREEIERLATQLESANTRLKELDRIKTEFVSIASHQLRSPLTAIKGYASLILEGSFGKVPVAVEEAAGRIFESSRLMADSVQDFLDVSRIEQGNMKYNFEKFDLRDLLRLCVEELTPIARDKKLRLTLESDEAESFTITGDLGKLKQVFTNLIDNSIKYTLRGSITVRLEKREGEAICRVSIIDTGVGVAKETMSELFDKFVRSRNAHKVNVSGTGLGLYVVKEMVSAHRGNVWVESEGEGKGSTFIVELQTNPDLAPPSKTEGKKLSTKA